jgi:hypothetical protein
MFMVEVDWRSLSVVKVGNGVHGEVSLLVSLIKPLKINSIEFVGGRPGDQFVGVLETTSFAEVITCHLAVGTFRGRTTLTNATVAIGFGSEPISEPIREVYCFVLI